MSSNRKPIEPGSVDSYPVLPLRDIVVFPHIIVPLFVGREKSIRALEEVMKADKPILLATQMNAADDDPATSAIFTTGTLATVLQLQDGRQSSGGEDRACGRIVVGRVHLRGEQDRLVRLHHFFERANRLLATDEQRHDDVRENDDVAQRQDWIGIDRSGF